MIQARVRAATRTLVMVVFTYLLSNIVNVVVTIWEYVDIDSLNGTFLTFYTFSVDVVGFFLQQEIILNRKICSDQKTVHIPTYGWLYVCF
jgi:hypothetical protein